MLEQGDGLFLVNRESEVMILNVFIKDHIPLQCISNCVHHSFCVTWISRLTHVSRFRQLLVYSLNFHAGDTSLSWNTCSSLHFRLDLTVTPTVHKKYDES